MAKALQISDARGNKSIHPEDLIFLTRHDKQTVNRLKLYLSWKDVRKVQKDEVGTGIDVEDIEVMDEVEEDGTCLFPS